MQESQPKKGKKGESGPRADVKTAEILRDVRRQRINICATPRPGGRARARTISFLSLSPSLSFFLRYGERRLLRFNLCVRAIRLVVQREFEQAMRFFSRRPQGKLLLRRDSSSSRVLAHISSVTKIT